MPYLSSLLAFLECVLSEVEIFPSAELTFDSKLVRQSPTIFNEAIFKLNLINLFNICYVDPLIAPPLQLTFKRRKQKLERIDVPP